MNIGFKIMAFIICLNVASGITSKLLPEDDFPGLPTSIDVSGESETELSILTNSTINPAGGAGSDPDTGGDRVLDFLHLGWIRNITTFVSNTLLGFTPFMIKLFGVFGKEYPYIVATNLAISFAYTLALILLWTGKKLN